MVTVTPQSLLEPTSTALAAGTRHAPWWRVFRVTILGLAIAGCAAEKPAQDARCPQAWSYDPTVDGDCNPPEGYAGLLWVELGGSGIYGFARDNACSTGDPTCQEMVGGLTVTIYHFVDLLPNGIRVGALPVGTALTSVHGLYKLRIQPGDYAVTTLYHQQLYAGEIQVVSNTVALFPFQVQD